MIITIECDKMNVNTMYSSIERSIKDEVHVVAKKEKKKEMELKMDLLLWTIQTWQQSHTVHTMAKRVAHCDVGSQSLNIMSILMRWEWR